MNKNTKLADLEKTIGYPPCIPSSSKQNIIKTRFTDTYTKWIQE